MRECLKRYRCASFGEFRTLLELYNIQVMEMTGTIDGRDYAGIVYGATGDDGYGRGKPIKSSRMGKDVGYEASQRSETRLWQENYPPAHPARSILELLDMQAYEERPQKQQRRQRRRKRRLQ